ncbi:hypothetical protein [Mucilaginibacter myungsuensis]|uniref:YD repeat-containing protein n=1 Tax=Mucilaginibacter myungsuensis TaxID=649104 RepID=A0A929PUS3_9SPHI|nr:hypothetical protein [Mucilaginibacter myungsuensis]MBE9661068.1 hypothetical protein [Mucilaginibacter myungsuensis]MDN3597212.1 hypothetical protein [Mucilaginibacter myungsuensis]
MKKNILAMAMLLPMAFAACKKNTGSQPEPKAQVKLLTKIAKVTRGGTDTVYTYISYDSRNHLTEMRTGNTVKTYNYTGDNLTSITNNDLTGKVMSTVLTFTYNGNVIAGAHAPNSMPALDYKYTYNVVNDRITKRNGPTQYTHEFTYSGNNLASYKLVGSGTSVYDYGLDKSPFYNARHKYYLTLPIEGEDMFSENNVVKITDATTPYFRGANYSYLVGNDGFPKTMTIQRTQFLDPEKFTYTEVVYSYTMMDVRN